MNAEHESQNKTLGAHNKIGDLAKSATMEPAFKYNNWLRTVPLFVTAHTLCASRDIRVSQGIYHPNTTTFLRSLIKWKKQILATVIRIQNEN